MMKGFHLLLVVTVLAGIECLCPQQADLLPCECLDSDITCSGHTNYSLKTIFNTVSSHAKTESEKHYVTFNLHNTVIEEFEDNVFGDITFAEIVFNGAENFKRFKPTSVANAVDRVESVLSVGESMIGLGSEVDLFHTLSSFNKLRAVQLEKHRVTTIPENAFTNSKQVAVETLDFNYFEPLHKKVLRQIKSVNNKAFYGLRNLVHLNLYGQSIADISAHAFDFEFASNNTLYITLSDNPLNGTIESGAFANIGRPTRLDVFDANWHYVDEKIFTAFLKADKRNHLIVGNSNTDNMFACDCRSHWLYRDRNLYSGQIDNGLKCDTTADMYSGTKCTAK